LAGDELPLSHSYALCDFLGSYEEPPGGKQRATKRQILNPPSFWVFGMNDLAVMNTHQATRVQ